MIYLRHDIAGISLLGVVIAYLFIRSNPPEILAPFQTISTVFATNSAIFGGAPSFFCTLAFGLAIGACTSICSTARIHCLSWIGLVLGLESSQQPVVAEDFSGWITTNFSDSISTPIGPYWTRGVFDPLDLPATLMGGVFALFLITRSPLEKNKCS